MNKLSLVLAICFGLTCGLFPAKADVHKLDFNLSSISISSQPKKDSVDSMNELIFLKARVKELEAELDKKSKGAFSKFGNAYVTEDGELKLKADDGGKDWNWDGKTWFRESTPIQSQLIFPENCPNGRCPLPSK